MMTIKQMIQAFIAASTKQALVEPSRKRSRMRVRIDEQSQRARPLKERKKELARRLAARKGLR